ncbi:hypothetical protein B0A49_03532 [Cryomyces minteri]|uniref:Uncharacterized protein n=1 Tax=Cryomyces minteri TaxID=331657 RepID=A0A4V5NFY3_9PEZI|nr:hypothetical protein B0A49_03532 [Cryomyces minteri]
MSGDDGGDAATRTMPDNLDGLALTRRERLLLVALSYAWVSPVIFTSVRRFYHRIRNGRPPPQGSF